MSISLATDPTHLESLVRQCLRAALSVHDSLGEAGEVLVKKNQFGETALRVDIECEQAILNVLEEMRVPIRVISEEHGQVDITANPCYLGILDGLDGSNVYKKSQGRGRYATMFGIFDALDPRYEDYLVSGIMELQAKRLYMAQKTDGAYVIEDSKKMPIHVSGTISLGPDTRIYIDEYWDINKRIFSEALHNFKPADRNFSSGSSAIHYADVAVGAADLALECTRKNNLEIAIAYGLIKEAGGVMIDLTGEPIGDKKYLTFGQKEHLPIVTAATRALADAVLKRVRPHR